MKRFVTVILCMILLAAGTVVSAEAAVSWNGVTPSPTVAATFSGGSGSVVDPYRISTPQDLAQLASNVNDGIDYKGMYFRLTADLTMNDISAFSSWEYSAPANKWAPIGADSNTPFRGYFDGNGHSISGIYVIKVTPYAGLFGYVSGGTVTNLSLSYAHISGADYVGGIAGYVTDSVYFAVSENHLNDCSFSGIVRGERYVGGIAGYSNVNMDGCTSLGEISAERFACGGIVGNNDGAVITLCSSSAQLSSPTALTGGIAGKSTGRIEKCWNLGEIKAAGMAGGIAGYNGGTVKNCFNAGAVRITDVYAGGIVAENDGNLSACYNVGVIEGEANVYAIVGKRTSGSVSACYYCTLCGVTDSSGVKGLTEAQMQTVVAFSSFDMADTWVLGSVSDYPYPTLRGGEMEFTCTHNSTVVIETPCTCEEDGALKTTCTVCGKVIATKKIGASHDYRLTSRQEPTCMEAGTETYTCAACGDRYQSVYGEAMGHTFESWITTKVATCTDNGERHRSCKNCDYEEMETLSSIAHSYEATVTDPTCTEKGYTTNTCRFCGDSYITDETEATGHTAGEWVVITKRSFAENELSKRYCVDCDLLMEQDSKPAYGFFLLGGAILLLGVVALVMITVSAALHRKKAALEADIQKQEEGPFDSRTHDPFDDTDEFFINQTEDERDKLSHTTLIRHIDDDPYEDEDDWD